MERLKANYLFKEDEKLLAEMKEAYLSCPAAVKYVRALKVPEEIVDKEIIRINDFVTDINTCSKCPGLANCPKAEKGLCTKIAYEEGVLISSLVPCKEFYKDLKFRSSFVVRDFDEKWLASDLRSINKNKERMEVVKKYHEIVRDELDEWIYIVGESGTGRSFLAANIAIDLAKNEYGQVAFIDTPSRFKELAGKKDEAFNSLLEKYCRVPVLVLDDLGNEYKSDFVRESILFPIINQRMKNHLLTIITSDFNINDIATMYTTNPASKPKVEQIKKMLKRMCPTEFNQGTLAVY